MGFGVLLAKHCAASQTPRAVSISTILDHDSNVIANIAATIAAAVTCTVQGRRWLRCWMSPVLASGAPSGRIPVDREPESQMACLDLKRIINYSPCNRIGRISFPFGHGGRLVSMCSHATRPDPVIRLQGNCAWLNVSADRQLRRFGLYTGRLGGDLGCEV